MTLGRWMAAYQQQEESAKQAIEQAAILQAMHQQESNPADEAALARLAAQVQELQKQLAQEQLHSKLLTALIDVAEEELKIPIRKKYGTRQSKK